MRVVLALALAGLRHRPFGWLLLAAGVAVTAVLPVVAAGLRLSAEAAAVSSAVDHLPPPERAVLGTSNSTVSAGQAQILDVQMRTGLRAAGVPDVLRMLVFRPLTVAGSSFTLAATDDLNRSARLTGGRRPASCTAQRCEVLAASAGASADGSILSVARLTPAATQLGLVITGTADLVDARPVGAGLVDGGVPMLLGSSVDQLGRSSVLELFGRTTAWLGTLDGGTVAAVGAETFGARLSELTDRLNTAGNGGLALSWPADQVTSAARRAVASASRFTVLGAAGASLQLGFCVVAAVGMRRRQQLLATLLTRRGAAAAQVVAVPLLQLTLAVAAGLLVGAAAGAVAVAASSGAVPAGRGAAAWLAVSEVRNTLAWLGVAAVGLAAAVALWPARAGKVTRVVLDCLLVATVGLTVLVLSGDSSGTADPLATSVTTLLAVAAGLTAARIWPPVLAGLSRLARGARAGPVWQVAVLSGRSRFLAPAATAAFIAAATCSTLFAGSYRATLDRSAEDQAAYQVPADVRVAPSRDVAAPLTVLDTTRLTALSPLIRLHPIISSSVTVFGGTNRAAGLPLVGLDPAALTEMHRFAQTTGADVDPGALAAALAGGSDQAAAGGTGAVAVPTIPAGTRVLSIAATGVTDGVMVQLWLADPDGAERRITMDPAPGGVRGTIDSARPLRVVGLELTESASHLMHRQHNIGEGSSDRELPAGTLTLAAVTADGGALPWAWDSWGSDQATVTLDAPSGTGGTGRIAGSGRLTAAFKIADVRVVMTPGFVPRNRLAPLPVAADPATAAAQQNGSVPVRVGGLTLPARVVAVLPRMPTIGARFLLADRRAVAALLDRAEPGTAAVNQLWITSPPDVLPGVRQVLDTPPASSATILVREDIRAVLAEDPVATRAGTLLLLAGTIALLMAVVAIAVGVRIERQDGAADQLSLELDGMRPSAIRRVLLLRSLLVVLIGIPVGAVVGVLLATVTVRLISVGAGGTSVQPPLQVDSGVGTTSVLLAVTVAAALLAASGTAALTLRERRPSIPEMDLR